MIAPAIQSALNALPAGMLRRSGSIFYTGQSAFLHQSDLYILGLNPGGSPTRQADETIGRALVEWRDAGSAHWSAYLDDQWEGKPAGMHGMQPRIAHMFRQIGRDLRTVPAANLIFARSRDEAALKTEKLEMLRACWPVH